MSYLLTYSSKDGILRAACLHNSSYIRESDKHIARQVQDVCKSPYFKDKNVLKHYRVV